MKVSHLLLDALETFPNFVIVDKKANVVYINDSYARLLGITKEDAIGQPVTDVIPNTRMKEILKTGKSEIGHLMTLYDHGQEKEVTVACNRMPIYRNNTLIGAAAVTIMQDVVPTIEQMNNEIMAIKKENEYYRHELNVIRSQPESLTRIVGHSGELQEVKEAIMDYAASNLPILITGETGVGKELFARAVHELSTRKLNPYVKINCAAIPSELLESELFGYEAGAFSGASKNGKPGKFELANNGTLLLDEIGEMPLTLQSKLLRVLQEHEIERVGGVQPIKINVRLICCTNQNLTQLIHEKKFRSDLYYRINTVELLIPPLRERKDDLPELADYFLQKYNTSHQEQVLSIDENVLSLFEKYDWPGNVRELEHVVERLCTINHGRSITAESCGFLIKRISSFLFEQEGAIKQDAPANQGRPDKQEVPANQENAIHNEISATKLPPTIRMPVLSTEYKNTPDESRHMTASSEVISENMDSMYLSGSETDDQGISLSERIKNAEKASITQALIQAGGNKTKAAKILNIDRSSLYYKIKKYHIL